MSRMAFSRFTGPRLPESGLRVLGTQVPVTALRIQGLDGLGCLFPAQEPALVVDEALFQAALPGVLVGPGLESGREFVAVMEGPGLQDLTGLRDPERLAPHGLVEGFGLLDGRLLDPGLLAQGPVLLDVVVLVNLLLGRLPGLADAPTPAIDGPEQVPELLLQVPEVRRGYPVLEAGVISDRSRKGLGVLETRSVLLELRRPVVFLVTRDGLQAQGPDGRMVLPLGILGMDLIDAKARLQVGDGNQVRMQVLRGPAGLQGPTTQSQAGRDSQGQVTLLQVLSLLQALLQALLGPDPPQEFLGPLAGLQGQEPLAPALLVGYRGLELAGRRVDNLPAIPVLQVPMGLALVIDALRHPATTMSTQEVEDGLRLDVAVPGQRVLGTLVLGLPEVIRQVADDLVLDIPDPVLGLLQARRRIQGPVPEVIDGLPKGPVEFRVRPEALVRGVLIPVPGLAGLQLVPEFSATVNLQVVSIDVADDVPVLLQPPQGPVVAILGLAGQPDDDVRNQADTRGPELLGPGLQQPLGLGLVELPEDGVVEGLDTEFDVLDAGPLQELRVHLVQLPLGRLDDEALKPRVLGLDAVIDVRQHGMVLGLAEGLVIQVNQVRLQVLADGVGLGQDFIPGLLIDDLRDRAEAAVVQAAIAQGQPGDGLGPVEVPVVIATPVRQALGLHEALDVRVVADVWQVLEGLGVGGSTDDDVAAVVPGDVLNQVGVDIQGTESQVLVAGGVEELQGLVGVPDDVAVGIRVAGRQVGLPLRDLPEVVGPVVAVPLGIEFVVVGVGITLGLGIQEVGGKLDHQGPVLVAAGLGLAPDPEVVVGLRLALGLGCRGLAVAAVGGRDMGALDGATGMVLPGVAGQGLLQFGLQVVAIATVPVVEVPGLILGIGQRTEAGPVLQAMLPGQGLVDPVGRGAVG